MTDDRLVVFVHIPKTAGNTMRSVLHRQYGQEACFGNRWGPGMPPDPHLILTADVPFLTRWYAERIEPGLPWYPEPPLMTADRFLQLPEERRAQIRAVTGHMTFGVERYLRQPTACFTLLRSPVDHVLSGYYYSTDDRPPVEDLHRHIAARLQGNAQTWILAGPHSGERPPDDVLLARAIRNLRACAVVGLTERFDETLLLLARELGWRWPFYLRRNVNRQRPPKSAIPAETLRLIEADNALDLALYDEAQRLFEAQVAAFGPHLQRDLERFRTLNSIWQLAHRARQIPRRTVRRLGHRGGRRVPTHT